MKRILMVLAVAALMVAMMALSAVPSFAQVVTEGGQEAEADVGSLFVVGGAGDFAGTGVECAGVEACSPPIAFPMSGLATDSPGPIGLE